MSVLIKHMAMPKGCIYANDKDQTDYCPMLNHDDVPFCQYIENEPEIAIGIDERPVYCPLSDVPDTNAGDLISRQAAIDALAKNMPSLTTPDGCGEFDHDIQVTDEAYVDCMQIIHELPSAPQWIPCSETVDIPDHEIIACDRHGELIIGYLAYQDDQWLCESDAEMMYDPIAWAEKPEPYREDTNGKT